MNIESSNQINSTSLETTSKTMGDKIELNTSASPMFPAAYTETNYSMDEATGLLQSIVTDKLSDEVIRKIPADEYLRLLSLLDEMISGSIDKQV